MEDTVNLYDMKPETNGRVLYTLWYLSITILGLLGNCIILTASVGFKAITLDKVSVMLIRHIAVADVLHILLVVIPAAVSIIRDGWVLGDTFCQIQTYLTPIFFSTSIFLLCGLNINKLVCLLNPLRSRSRSSRTGCKIGAAFWLQVVIAMAIVHLSAFACNKEWDYHYSAAVFHCTGTYVDSQSFYEILTAVSLLVPCFVVLVTTVCLFCFVHKVYGVQKQSVQTLVLVSTIFIISFFPFGVATAMVASGDPLKSFGIHFVVYLRIATSLANLNTGVNALIYYFTIKSFSDFVKNQLLKKMRQLFRDRNKIQDASDLSKSSGTVLTLPMKEGIEVSKLDVINT